MCPPFIFHIIIVGSVNSKMNNKNKKEAIVFATIIFLRLKGICVKIERVFCFFSRLIKGTITNGKNNEKSMNNPPKVGTNTPCIGSNPLAYKGLCMAATLASL